MGGKFEKLKTGWYIWLFPLFALALTGWLLYGYFMNQGPRIYIAFDDAAGIQAEKTSVRFRGVAIGVVKDVRISEDQRDAIVEVLLRQDADDFAVEGSKFSLVTPKVDFQGVSGLSTIFEGAYIAALPGPDRAKAKSDFKALSLSATDPQDETSAYLLETANAESVSTGDSVTYRGVKIGSVTALNFPKGSQTVQVRINVENKYVHLIRDNTVFWRKAGIQAKLGLFNSEVKINSFDTLMNGGIEIATPDPAGARAKALQKFYLAESAPKNYTAWRPALD